MSEAEKWFEDYDGPKTLCWDDGQFVCGVGVNLPASCGGVTGEELTARATSAARAVAEVKARYDRLTWRS